MQTVWTGYGGDGYGDDSGVGLAYGSMYIIRV